ncbi:hypothetical protein GobsT_50090 [Gemmata obscuriglobus]|nr:hypothetical protein GobsT_50090 [Gemmata obscuriglobus]VTS09530.1 unnamed protein product [Gemmata obscuriglobus UQM 2246]
MMDDLTELCDTPATENPVAAALVFAAGALIGVGSTFAVSRSWRDCARRKEMCEGMER